MAGMDESSQGDVQRSKWNLFWAITLGVVTFAIWTLEDRDLWSRPHFWVINVLASVGCALLFFCIQWFYWRE